ncbi:MAG: hypothetical protein ACOX9E_13535 [Lentisphaeria bacterium]|jgi:hypothetical protein
MNNSPKDIFQKFLLCFVIITGCCVSGYVFFHVEPGAFHELWILPIFYVIVQGWIIKKYLFKNASFFLWSFFIISSFRYLILPFLIVLANYYDGRALVIPKHESVVFAIRLMCYELCIYGLLISFLEARSKNHARIILSKDFVFTNNYTIYLIFIFISMISLFIVPRTSLAFGFFTPKYRSMNSFTRSLSMIEVMAIYCLFVSKYLILFIGISFLHSLWVANNKSRVIRFMVFLWVLINLSIVFGTNRSDYLLPSVASLLFYAFVFKDFSLGKLFVSFLLILFVFISLTKNREYASYSRNQSSLVDLTDSVSCYCGGPYNVAMAIEVLDNYPEVRNFKRLIFDVFRPMIGPNIFLRNSKILLSNYYFNDRIWRGGHFSQILPMIGQGYIYFGTLLSPLLGCLVILLAYKLENFIAKSNSPECFLFVSFSLIRFGFLMGQNINNIVNDLSMNLFLFFVLYLVNILYSSRRIHNLFLTQNCY